MQYLFYFFALIFATIGAIFSIENWCILRHNIKNRGQGAPVPYYPFIGSLFLFWALCIILPLHLGYWCYLALVLDYGCLPMCLHWCCNHLSHR
ncbi:MAG: hypothetical protein E7031_08535 [Akkermansiaceae bacterium]|nr:hypothetical protein [Akkermansiaceae bacterium]